MVISISIAAALAELQEKVPDITAKELMQSGDELSAGILWEPCPIR